MSVQLFFFNATINNIIIIFYIYGCIVVYMRLYNLNVNSRINYSRIIKVSGENVRLLKY